jgi:hypothetical protein
LVVADDKISYQQLFLTSCLLLLFILLVPSLFLS